METKNVIPMKNARACLLFSFPMDSQVKMFWRKLRRKEIPIDAELRVLL